jgi:hypothetical protein
MRPEEVTRCPHCRHALDEDWLRKQGARLMGRKGGKRKARNSDQARKAANERWARNKEII